MAAILIHDNFKNIKKHVNESVDGILFDLGVSSTQLENGERGFSFHKDAKLDMRMDTTKELSAYNVVNEYSYEELVRVIRDYGEEKYATSIAKNKVKDRESKPIETTFELVDIIKKSMPYKAMKDKLKFTSVTASATGAKFTVTANSGCRSSHG